MNDDYIVPVYTILDDILQLMNYQDDVRATMSAAEILTIAVVSAKYFQNHHERALCVLYRLGYITELSVSRFNRRLHALMDWLWHVSQVLSDLFASGQVFIIDAMPVPVCKRVRAQRCRKVQGDAYYGFCASKQEKFFGWQLHLVCDAQGIPVSFELLPASCDELEPLQYLLAPLSEGSVVVADKGYLSAREQQLAWQHGRIHLAAKFRKNMKPKSRYETELINHHRPTIETVHSQLEKMGLQRLHARTTIGFAVKVLASLVAVTFTNLLD